MDSASTFKTLTNLVPSLGLKTWSYSLRPVLLLVCTDLMLCSPVVYQKQTVIISLFFHMQSMAHFRVIQLSYSGYVRIFEHFAEKFLFSVITVHLGDLDNKVCRTFTTHTFCRLYSLLLVFLVNAVPDILMVQTFDDYPFTLLIMVFPQICIQLVSFTKVKAMRYFRPNFHGLTYARFFIFKLVRFPFHAFCLEMRVSATCSIILTNTILSIWSAA